LIPAATGCVVSFRWLGYTLSAGRAPDTKAWECEHTMKGQKRGGGGGWQGGRQGYKSGTQGGKTGNQGAKDDKQSGLKKYNEKSKGKDKR